MVTCEFCARRFKNAQALRAHLGHCPQRRARQSAEPTGSRPGSQAAYRQPGSLKAGWTEPRPGGVAEPVLDELQAERAKLDLRKVKAEHRRLDEEEVERARQARERKEAARQQAEAEALAREQARLEADERQEREAAEAARARQRRESIQRVKGRVMDWAWTKVPFGVTLPRETEARARAEIERELAGLSVEEIPESELVDIAEGIRDQIYRPVIEAQEREQKAQRQAQQEEFGQSLQRLTEAFAPPPPEERRAREEAERRERQKREEERRSRQAEWARQQRERQERAEEARLEANRQRLASHGYYHVLRVLNEENELDPLERFQVAREVKEQLLDELDGDETADEVEDLAAEILDEELGEE